MCLSIRTRYYGTLGSVLGGWFFAPIVDEAFVLITGMLGWFLIGVVATTGIYWYFRCPACHQQLKPFAESADPFIVDTCRYCGHDLTQCD